MRGMLDRLLSMISICFADSKVLDWKMLEGMRGREGKKGRRKRRIYICVYIIGR